MKIITVHGIRTDAAWYQQFKDLPIWKKNGAEIYHFDYGFLSIGAFLMPWRRAKVVKKFSEFYSNNFDPAKPPSIVCHSFGTYIFFSAIKRYSVIKFDKVILCGSILSPEISWLPFFENGRLNLLYNDYGSQDSVVKFSAYAISGCGRSGQVGFKEIPSSLNKKIVQRNNFLDHSGYFLPLHMQENWGKILLPQKAFKYNPKILRPEIIERIYKNIGISNEESLNLEHSSAVYQARIDDRGNYFANYTKSFINRAEDDLNTYIVHTTADSLNSIEEMDFHAYAEGGQHLHIEVKDDSVQDKTFIIHLNEPVKQNHFGKVNYKFKWRETMNYRGDTDHFDIKDISDVTIKLNFRHRFHSARFFMVKNNAIISENTANRQEQLDGTMTYFIEIKNNDDYDGAIFYFENNSNIGYNNLNMKKLGSLKTDAASIIVHRCTPREIKDVYKIELNVEHSNAATEVTLKERLAMFNDGFLVAKANDKIVGYIESVIWKDMMFDEFNEIKNFPLHYDVKGDTMYIIFVAVSEAYRRKGVGTLLLQSLEKVANRYNVKKIKLVAKDDLLTFYKNVEFNEVKELPNFLGDRDYKSMLMEKYIN